jgi:hypothetical protein
LNVGYLTIDDQHTGSRVIADAEDQATVPGILVFDVAEILLAAIFEVCVFTQHQ